MTLPICAVEPVTKRNYLGLGKYILASLHKPVTQQYWATITLLDVWVTNIDVHILE